MPPKQLSSLSPIPDVCRQLLATSVRITFTASGPLGLRVQGRGRELGFLDDAGTLVLSVPLRSITTGIGMRDSAMHELLGTRRHPFVELRVPLGAISLPGDKRCVGGACGGTLNLRGKSGPIEVSYRLERKGEMIGVTGAFRIPVDEWGIMLPRHMGFGLKSHVPVKAAFSVPAAVFGCATEILR